MRLIDVIRIAIRMVRTNMLRSLLTVMGIGVAISFIVVLIGLGYGLQSLTIGSIVKSKLLYSLEIQAQEGKPLTELTLQEVGSIEGVENVSPLVATNGRLTIDSKLAEVAVFAGNELYLDMEGIEMSIGRGYKDGTREAVVSPQILELLAIEPEDVVGKTVSLAYNDPNNENDSKKLDNLLVVGLSSGTDSPAVYLPYGLFTSEGPVLISAVKAVAKDRPTILSVRSAMTSKGYQVASLIETLDQAKRVFNWATIGLAAFGGIALVVASIGMFNTLTIALIERTREIGIMKAIGVTDRAIQELFLAEAAIIGFFGGLFGIAVGVLLGFALESVLNQLATAYEGTSLQLFQYPPFFLPAILLFPIILAMVTGLYPASRAAKLNPLRALRYE